MRANARSRQIASTEIAQDLNGKAQVAVGKTKDAIKDMTKKAAAKIDEKL